MIRSDQQCVILRVMHSSDLFLAGSNHQHGGGGIYVCGGSGEFCIVHTDLKKCHHTCSGTQEEAAPEWAEVKPASLAAAALLLSVQCLNLFFSFFFVPEHICPSARDLFDLKPMLLVS